MKHSAVAIASPITLTAAFGGAYLLHISGHHDLEVVPLYIGIIIFMVLTVLIFREDD